MVLKKNRWCPANSSDDDLANLQQPGFSICFVLAGCQYKKIFFITCRGCSEPISGSLCARPSNFARGTLCWYSTVIISIFSILLAAANCIFSNHVNKIVQNMPKIQFWTFELPSKNEIRVWKPRRAHHRTSCRVRRAWGRGRGMGARSSVAEVGCTQIQSSCKWVIRMETRFFFRQSRHLILALSWPDSTMDVFYGYAQVF